MTLKLKNGDTIVFIGDSITDCGRRGPSFPLGSGYVKSFSDLAAVRETEKRLKVINRGIGGDTVQGLLKRCDDDIIWHKPQWLSIKIGINDLHHYLFSKDETFSPRNFTKDYEALLDRSLKALPKCNVLLIDPFYISRALEGHRGEVLKILPTYINIVHKLSRKYGTRLVKTHDVFQALLKYRDCEDFCPEPVHPNPLGHLAIAEAVYAALSR